MPLELSPARPRKEERSSGAPPRPHAGVARRLRILLGELRLSREEFAAALDGAIDARSVFSLLNGSRRPSRGLAVLIERTWGFRADFLLHGDGRAWVEAPINGRPYLLDRPPHLPQLRLWSRLLGRAAVLVEELDAFGSAATADDLHAYPDMARLVYEECLFMAERYGELSVLLHRLRVLRLAQAFLARFVEAQPMRLFSAEEARELQGRFEPIRARQCLQVQALEAEIRSALETIERLCPLESPAHAVRARVRASATDPAAAYRSGLDELLRDLLHERREDGPCPRSDSVEALLALRGPAPGVA